MSMEYGQAKLSFNQLHQLKHLMGAVLTSLSIWALFSLDINSELLLLPAVILVGVLVIKPDVPQMIPERAWRYVTPALVVIILSDFVSTAPEFIPSLVRMIVWLLIYRNLAPRRQREDMQLILLCLFCVVLSGVMTVSLLFALQILLFTPLAMFLLFLICLSERGREEAVTLDWNEFKWLRLLRDLRRVVNYQVLVLCNILFGFVVFVSTILFILTPRFHFDRAIPFLEVRTQPMTGFSDDGVSLGDVSEVSEDTSVAVRIDVPSLGSLQTVPYWRMLVLDQYQDGNFRMSASLRRQLKTVAIRELTTVRGPRPNEASDIWTFYLDGGISRFLPVPGQYGIMRFQAKQDIQFYEEAMIHGLESVKQGVFSYQLEGLQFSSQMPAGETEVTVLNGLIKDNGDYPDSTAVIQLSEEDRGYLRVINEEILDGKVLNASEYARAADEYLNAKFRYSLSPDGQVDKQSPSEDPIVNWLLEGSLGHCELFAGAFVLLAREMGIPTRMIVGFTGGSWNGVEDYFLLRNSDAHAWVEFYDQETQLWVRGDPTPSGIPGTSLVGQESFQIETGWDAWVDSLRIQWYRRIVNFEQEDQLALFSAIKTFTSNFSAEFRTRIDGISEFIKERLVGESAYSAFAVLAFGFLVIAVALYLLWRCRDSLRDWFYLLAERQSRLLHLRQEASKLLKKVKMRKPEQENHGLVLELQAIRFGPEISNEAARQTFTSARRYLRGS